MKNALIHRLMPKSLAGQMALLLGLALLVAQCVNFALILNERQKLSLAQNEAPALTRFATVATNIAQSAPEFRQALLEDNSYRGARFALYDSSNIATHERDRNIETRLAAALSTAGVSSRNIMAATGAGNDFGENANHKRPPPPDAQFLRLAVKTNDGQWLIARMITPRRDPWLGVRLGAATLALYLIVLGASVWIARRLARPLRHLTEAAEQFHGRADPITVTPSGPEDLQKAISAFNDMNRRVVALVDEKDRMLGAIGHDLRTPLASLRIRIESMEPAEDRLAAVACIAEMTAMLEDILTLARTGRAREEARPMDVTALAETIVEEYEDMGAAVSFTPSARLVTAVQPNLMRRAVRNLIDNALKYAGNARVSVSEDASGIAICVADDGPGIAADKLQDVLQPFYRIETSRNRETGGSGLGLAIARSIAENHGGSLQLQAGDAKGLVAMILLPIAPAKTRMA